MFFFFDFYDMQSREVVNYCLNKYVHSSFETKNYCDISELFSDNITKVAAKEKVLITSDELNILYRKKFPENEGELRIVGELYSNKVRDRLVFEDEAFAVLFWCFKTFKKNRSFEKNKESIMSELINFLYQNEYEDCNYACFDSIIYDKNNTELYVVNSLCTFLDTLKEFHKEQPFYFRGHSKASYKLTPSVMRSAKLKENENLIYQELIIDCPDDFKECKRHLDYLVKMQHYGLPTRLLDITRNPLVALYFACCHNTNNVGEVIVFSPNKKQIKYENSDTVAMLSSLPMFSYEDQIELMDKLYLSKKDENIVERFIHEISVEKPGFTNRINTKDLESCFIVLPKKDNNRIIKQDGAFIICGINNNFEKTINEKLCLTIKNKKPLIFITNKEAILKELDLLSINKSTLFPEIDNVSEYIKSKYGS